MIRLALAVVLTLSVLATPSSSRAQTDSSASVVGAARDLFREGVRAAEEERWDDAVSAFERSYALAPRDATVLNLAVVLGESGHLVAAIEAYRRFLARADAETRADRGREAEQAIALLEARLASLSLAVRGLGEDDVVELDGEPITRAAMGLDLPVDPGEHVVTIVRGGHECARSAVSLGERARRDLELVVTCPVIEPDLEAIAAVQPAEDPAPWIVLGVVGGLLVIGAVVAGVVIATQPQDPGPFRGNVGMFVLP